MKSDKRKIYFSGAIRAGRNDTKIYHQIILYLGRFGKVLTEFVGDESTTEEGEAGLEDSKIHKRDMELLKEADIIVAEVTTPSLGVGYEIGVAVENEKPVLCLYRPGNGKLLSAMISGSPAITLGYYNSIANAEDIIKRFFKNIGG